MCQISGSVRKTYRLVLPFFSEPPYKFGSSKENFVQHSHVFQIYSFINIDFCYLHGIILNGVDQVYLSIVSKYNLNS